MNRFSFYLFLALFNIPFTITAMFRQQVFNTPTFQQDKINEIVNSSNDVHSHKISVSSMNAKLDFKCTQYGCTYRVVYSKNAKRNLWKQLTNNPIHDHSKRFSNKPVVKKRKLLPGENMVDGVYGKSNDQSLTLTRKLKLEKMQLEKENK